MFHLKTKVAHFNGDVEVSTVDLNLEGWTTGKGFETCLFFPNGESEVVGWYANQEAAAAGHAAFSNESVLRFIEQIRNTRDYLQRGVDEYMEVTK